jgi:hypothetical protein
MLRLLLALFILTFSFAGCTGLNRRDRNFVQGQGVSEAVQNKMRHHEPLALDDIIELSQKGIPAGFIIHYLRPTYYVYKLNFDDVARLRHSGVNEDVIRYLSATPTMFSPTRQPVWYEDYSTGIHSSDPYWGYRRY